jgi:hypothetical protein
MQPGIPATPTPRPDDLGFIPANERAPRLLARAAYREMLAHGFTQDQVLAFASELVALVTEDDEHASDA